jgi:hypothetical protein
MAQTSIDTTQLARFQEALKRSPAKLRETLQRIGVECAKIMEHHLKRKAPQFLGELQSSIDGRVAMEGNNTVAAVVSPVPYAHIQDVGRRPGKMPPEQPIRRWVELKLFKRAGIKPGRGKASRESFDRQVDSLTYLVRRKIAKHGTKPTLYIDKAVAAATPALTKRMQALAGEIARMLDE